jgi:hypothetical protein|tara:strand:- start:4359 stop:4679 length:321 start_codon:yes stop_codon:yes gene_type:complete
MGNIMNMLGLGMDMGVNFDNLSMAQKRMELGNMFDPMEAGRERLRAMTAPTTSTATGMNPMMLQTLMQGLLSQPEQPQMPVMPMQEAVRGMQLPQVDLQQYYGGLL